MRDGFVFVPANTVVNAHYVGALREFGDLAEAVGDAAGAAAARANATALAAAMRARLFNASAGAFVDGLGTAHAAVHSTAYALARGVAGDDGGVAAAAWAALVARLRAEASVGIPVGPYPGLFYGEALFANTSDHGRAAVADFLLNNKTNGWLAQLRAGATTTMESWAVAEKANLTWSHPWMAFALQLIARWLLGVRALAPGYARVLVMPQAGALARVSGAVPTVRGAITLAYAQSVGADGLPTAVAMNVTIPGAVSGRVCVAAGACSGGRVGVDGGVVTGEAEGDYWCVEVGAGAHAVVCPV